MKDPYVVLGVAKTATQDDIKKAYRNLAKKFHPDLNPGNKEAERRFKEINDANDVLMDAKKREQWDRFGAAAFEQGFDSSQSARAGGAGRGGPFYYESHGDDGGRYTYSYNQSFDEDLFSQIFGGMGGGARARAQERGPRDEQYELEVDFMDAARGAERELTLPSGKRLRVKIPAGIDSGARLRFAGQAASGGDAYVRIQVRPSPTFRRVDKNVEIELPVTIAEAVSGAEIRVPTLDGEVLMKIPAGVSTGSKLKLRGKGIAREGDQIVIVKLVMPPNVDSELKEFMKQWSARHPYNPREASHAA